MSARLGRLSASIDSRARRAYVGEREFSVTATEFGILELLLDNPDWVVTHDQLSAELPDGAGAGRSLSVHVANLRRKMRLASSSETIQSVRGVGYRLVRAVVETAADADVPPVNPEVREPVLAAVDDWLAGALRADALADCPLTASMLESVASDGNGATLHAPSASLCHELLALVRSKATLADALVVLENIEAADKATLDILRIGFARLVDVPIAVLLACAEDEAGILTSSLKCNAGSDPGALVYLPCT